jgi:glucose-6-phosphate 1-dehydrogenase
VSQENPFQDPLRFERGAPGDLARRKLIPALYRLARQRLLPPGFAVLGTSRTPLRDEAFRDKMRASVAGFLEDTPLEEEVWGVLEKARTPTMGLYSIPWQDPKSRAACLSEQ